MYDIAGVDARELYHYGVKGMRWGVTRSLRKSAASRSANISAVKKSRAQNEAAAKRIRQLSKEIRSDNKNPDNVKKAQEIRALSAQRMADPNFKKSRKTLRVYNSKKGRYNDRVGMVSEFDNNFTVSQDLFVGRNNVMAARKMMHLVKTNGEIATIKGASGRRLPEEISKAEKRKDFYKSAAKVGAAAAVAALAAPVAVSVLSQAANSNSSSRGKSNPGLKYRDTGSKKWKTSRAGDFNSGFKGPVWTQQPNRGRQITR